jgi:hypothetical protein
MSALVNVNEQERQITLGKIEKVLVTGRLEDLNAEERLTYYNQLCETLGLNPLTQPFEYLNLKGKLTLYAKKNCAEQLRRNHQISITNVETKIIGDIYIVTCYAKSADGRQDVSTGAVNIKGLTGENLANAYLKAETKAKARVTYSMGGLGLLDESEVQDIPGARIANENPSYTVEVVKEEPKQIHNSKKADKIASYLDAAAFAESFDDLRALWDEALLYCKDHKEQEAWKEIKDTIIKRKGFLESQDVEVELEEEYA